MKTYNKFVDYYDEIIRGSGYDLESEVFFINEVIEDHGSGKNILEFACGTGTIARELEKRGYSVTGVDLSEQMIKKAQENVDMNDFIIGDMTSINLEKQFDIVLCNYNSVCHLKDWSAWKGFFKNAYKHLKKDGILIFDILTIFEFENITRDFRGFFNVKGDTICLEMFKKENKDIFTWLIKMFVSTGKKNFVLIEEEIREISFSIEQIQKELEKVGFSVENIEDFHSGELTAESERVYFIVKK